MVQKLKMNWCESMRSHHEQSGLLESTKKFICSSILSANDILAMEGVALCPESKHKDIREIILMAYTQPSGDEITITVGSLLLNVLYHANAINTYFSGHSHPLHIYVIGCDGWTRTLPVCADGRFMSWGFASRVAGVGDFNGAAPLHYFSPEPLKLKNKDSC